MHACGLRNCADSAAAPRGVSLVCSVETTAHARVDLSALRDNLTVVRMLCPHSRVMAMVKADAYGHGLLPVARALEEAEGFAVARFHEAMLLREAGIKQRILILGTLLNERDLAVCSESNIDVTAHNPESLASILTQATRTPLRVWLKLDSGMHRIGFDPDAFVQADRMLRDHAGILDLVHMTHFSSAGQSGSDMVDQQMACFWACHRMSSKAQVSLANSAALILRSDTHADWVRPGIMLYGDNPVPTSNVIGLRPVMTLRARVISVRTIRAHEAVGYNSGWTSTRTSRIGTLGIGYGDGYPRHAQNGTPVWIDGKIVPLVGRVSMDSLAVDLTDHGRARVGDEAVLWGPELAVSTVAACAATISYELFTSVSPRVPREYRGILPMSL